MTISKKVLKKAQDQINELNKINFIPSENDMQKFESTVTIILKICELLNIPSTNYNEQKISEIASNKQNIQDFLILFDKFPLTQDEMGLLNSKSIIEEKHGTCSALDICALLNFSTHIYNEKIINDWLQQKISYTKMLEECSNDYDFLNEQGILMLK